MRSTGEREGGHLASRHIVTRTEPAVHRRLTPSGGTGGPQHVDVVLEFDSQEDGWLLLPLTRMHGRFGGGRQDLRCVDPKAVKRKVKAREAGPLDEERVFRAGVPKNAVAVTWTLSELRRRRRRSLPSDSWLERVRSVMSGRLGPSDGGR